ncbi:hypothetical protein HanPSC8_Chr12g0540361 [Helianthus annuus]|nr:hypothetical protein HanPSC8_Chr12g0540361 [Helianthus annuus]
MKSELSISDFQALQTDRNRINGSLFRIISSSSTGSLFMIIFWRSKGMLSDILNFWL